MNKRVCYHTAPAVSFFHSIDKNLSIAYSVNTMREKVSPVFCDNFRALYNTDSRLMVELRDNSVQCVVTSPPYWLQRKYHGIQDVVWGGRADCEHDWGSPVESGDNRYRGVNSKTGRNMDPGTYDQGKILSGFCRRCGAWRGAFGHEPTPGLYVEHTIEFLREIKRVLRKDGVVFWVIDDSRAGSGKASGRLEWASGSKQLTNPGSIIDSPTPTPGNLKRKDLCLIPERVVIAAQNDGWWVNSKIIWYKRNAMPENVTDRPTDTHEYILMLSKSRRHYWDNDAVRVQLRPSSFIRMQHPRFNADSKSTDAEYTMRDPVYNQENTSRNIRTVWDIPTTGYKEKHYASFPEALAKLCISAATPEGGACSTCGKPYQRILDNGVKVTDHKRSSAKSKTADEQGASPTSGLRSKQWTEHKTIGWQPTCKHTGVSVPAIVLDPFAGTGTTLYVAGTLGRCLVGYEISREYCDLVVKRILQHVLV